MAGNQAAGPPHPFGLQCCIPDVLHRHHSLLSLPLCCNRLPGQAPGYQGVSSLPFLPVHTLIVEEHSQVNRALTSKGLGFDSR